jgi:flagellar basal-body rod modification protein FlgD
MSSTTIDKPASLDVNGVPTADQLSTRRVSATLDGNQLKSSNLDNAGSTKVFDNAAKTLGKQDFLNLLVTQLRFQDPMAPTENTEFVAQLAQFSNLEGTQNINTSIEDLGKQITSLVASQKSSSDAIGNSSATSLIGKQVRVDVKTVDFDPKKDPISINVHSDPGQASVLTVLDAKENILNAVPIPSPGENLLQWNGTKLDGTKVPPGKYTLRVTTLDGKTDTGYAYMQDRVSGINFTKDGMRLEVRNQSFGIDQVVHVGEGDVAGD